MAADAESVFAPLVAAAERSGLADFMRWWRGELAAMVPARVRERMASRSTAYVGVEQDEWCVFRPVAGRLAQAGRVSMASLDTAGRRGAFRRLLAELPGAAGNAWLVLPQESVLLREVHMPLAAEEALRDAIGFDLDRLTPLPAGQAWFDYRVTGRDAAAQRLTLTLAVTPRAPVEARLAELRELGATVQGVGTVDDVATSSSPLNLLPVEQRDRPATSGAAIAARSLAGLAAILVVAALLYPLWLKREAVIALHPRLEKASAGAEVAERIGREVEKLAAEYNFVLARKHAQVPVVSVIEDLSRLLPDTTWAQQLDIKQGPKGRELQLAGETGSSSQLIEVLEQSGTFANPSFKSPLTKGATPGTERFLLTAEVKPKPLPEPLPESALLSRAADAGAPRSPAPPPATAAPAPAMPATADAESAPPAAGPAVAPGAASSPAAGATPAPGGGAAAAPGAGTSTPGAAAPRVYPAPPKPGPAGDPAKKG